MHLARPDHQVPRSDWPGVPTREADTAGLVRLAAGQRGLFRSEQALMHGFSQGQLGRLITGGWCERRARGIYAIAGAGVTFEQQALAAAWAAGPDAVASHRAAARIWRLPGWTHAVAEVTRPRGENQRSAVGLVHTCIALPTTHVTTMDGIPVTTPARTCFDLAGVVPRGRVEVAVDAALQRKLCRIEEVQQAHFALARRGRRGTVAMRAILRDRGTGFVPPASELERRARKLIVDAGLPVPEFEVDLGDEAWIGRVDCVWRGEKVIVELDGRRYHHGLSARNQDRERDNRLMAAGWRVIRVTWDDIVDRPSTVVTWIRRALDVHQLAG